MRGQRPEYHREIPEKGESFRPFRGFFVRGVSGRCFPFPLFAAYGIAVHVPPYGLPEPSEVWCGRER